MGPLMTSRALRLALAAVLLSLTVACASGHVREGDRFAKQGKYEDALVEYRAAQKIQATNRVLKRINKVEKTLSEIWVKKGLEAAKAGAMGEAAGWWSKAAEVRPNDTKPGSPRVVIAENAAKLEVCGDEAMKERKWEESFTCWETLRIAYPDRIDLQTRIDEAKKMFAADLDRDAQALAKKGLTGAALVLAMRARTYDPLQEGGFSREQKYRAELASASLVNIASVAMEDRGHWALAGYLAPAIEKRLASHPPYGPTTNPLATQAAFAAAIEQFAWWDEQLHGYTKKESDAKPADSKKQPNPEHAAQKVVVEKLEKELKQMEAAAKAGAAAPAAVATPAPAVKPAGGKGKAAAAPVATPPPAKRTLASRAPGAGDVEKKRKELDAARAKLASMPEQTDAGTAASAYYLPWTEVTRVVEATVRFEVREPDFGEPVTKTVTLRVTSKDRTNAADEAHKIAADPLELRAVEDLVRELAKDLAGPGTAMLEEARERRAERWIQKGREAHAKGGADESLDCYVRALFAKGVEGGSLPGDAATHVAIRLEEGSFRDIVAGP